MSEKQSSNAFFWGFVAGAVATGIYTLLKTPRSGREIVEQVRTQADQLLGRSQKETQHWQQATHPTAPGWQAQAEQAASQAQAAAQDMAQAATEQAGAVVEAGQSAASDMAKAAQQALES